MKLQILFVLVAACGGSKPAPKAEMKPAESHDMNHDMHEMKMAPELTGFHDVLAPRWHAAKGEQRMKDTCAAVPQFQTQADAIAKATPPAGADATKWSAQAKDLGEAVTALAGTCTANDAAAFEPAFEKLHTAFHALMETGGGEHDEQHEQHEHKM